MNVVMDSSPASQRLPTQPAAISATALALGTLLLGGAGTWLSASSRLQPPPAPIETSTPKASSPPAVSALPLPRLLSETGYRAPSTLEYAPQYPLWSDGASKRRFVSIPEGEAIDASDPDAWR